MPKPNSLDLTWEDVQKEMASWPSNSSKPRTIDQLTEEQKKILCGMMRSGKKMRDILGYWKNMRMPGSSATTLRSMFKDLEEQGY